MLALQGSHTRDSVDRGGDDVTVVIVDVSPRHLFHVYIASFLRSLIYTRVLLS